jgi:hypothetical protein
MTSYEEGEEDDDDDPDDPPAAVPPSIHLKNLHLSVIDFEQV